MNSLWESLPASSSFIKILHVRCTAAFRRVLSNDVDYDEKSQAFSIFASYIIFKSIFAASLAYPSTCYSVEAFVVSFSSTAFINMRVCGFQECAQTPMNKQYRYYSICVLQVVYLKHAVMHLKAMHTSVCSACKKAENLYSFSLNRWKCMWFLSK